MLLVLLDQHHFEHFITSNVVHVSDLFPTLSMYLLDPASWMETQPLMLLANANTRQHAIHLQEALSSFEAHEWKLQLAARPPTERLRSSGSDVGSKLAETWAKTILDKYG